MQKVLCQHKGVRSASQGELCGGGPRWLRRSQFLLQSTETLDYQPTKNAWEPQPKQNVARRRVESSSLLSLLPGAGTIANSSWQQFALYRAASSD